VVQTLTWQEFSRRSEEAADRCLIMIQNFNKEFPDPDGKELLSPPDQTARSEYVSIFRTLLAKHYSIGPAPSDMTAGAASGDAGSAADSVAEGDDYQVSASGDAGDAGGAVAGGIVGGTIAAPETAAIGGAASGERGEEDITDETDTTYRTDVNRGY
jgi:hypothetical protein